MSPRELYRMRGAPGYCGSRTRGARAPVRKRSAARTLLAFGRPQLRPRRDALSVAREREAISEGRSARSLPILGAGTEVGRVEVSRA